MPLTFLIADTDLNREEIIHQMIMELDPENQILEANSIETAILAMKRCPPDVIFSDINMKSAAGLSLSQHFTHKNSELIITSSSPEDALKAFREDACDYILKPLKKSEIRSCLLKSVGRIEKKLTLKKISQEDALSYPEKRLVIHYESGLKLIDLKDLIYLKADNSYTTLYLSDGQKILTSKPINYFEKKLCPHWFFRIHKSSMINLLHVKEYSSRNSPVAKMTDDIQLPISKQRLMEFLVRTKATASSRSFHEDRLAIQKVPDQKISA